MKIIFENKFLLKEIKMEQVLPRFESEQFFLAAAEQNLEFEKNNIKPQDLSFVKGMMKLRVPNDIREKYKAEALNWIITQFIKNPTSFYKIKYVPKAIEVFYQIKEQNLQWMLKKSNIYSIRTPEELIEITNEAAGPYQKHLQNKNNSDASQGTNKIYENDSWEVFIPENKGAACELGKGTEWCTAVLGLDYYEQYHKKEDPLIIFINKKDPTEKYQFHYGSSQFMDSMDHTIVGKKLFFKLNNIVQDLKDKLPSDTIKKTLNYKYEEHGDIGYKTVVDGRIKTYKSDGRLHSFDDKPAIIRPNDSKYWYQDGKLHRDNDQPAIISSNDSKQWYQKGELHRDNDQPAVINSDGEKQWHQNGKLHRDNDQPALINSYGEKYWYQNGKRTMNKKLSERKNKTILTKPFVVVNIGKKSYICEVVSDDRRRSKGLSKRTVLKEWEGMLFEMDGEDKHSFQMRDTYVPLDIIFIGKYGNIIDFVHNAQPLTDGPYAPKKKCLFVLEVRGNDLTGKVKENDLTKMRFFDTLEEAGRHRDELILQEQLIKYLKEEIDAKKLRKSKAASGKDTFGSRKTL